MRRIVVIMTCFNRKEKTVNCIKSLMAAVSTDVSFDFVVVDDNSSDGTREKLAEFSNVDIVLGTGSLFYTGGMHKGISYAKQKFSNADYYMLVNDDVEFDSVAIHKMVLSADSTKVLVGATRGTDGRFSYGGTLYTTGIKYEKIGPDRPDVNCTTFNCNCTLVPNEIFFAVGNIDPYYKHSMGDFDYGWQVSRLGYAINVFDEFIGTCDPNPVEGTWNDRSLSRIKRFKLKESFKGLPFRDWFHYLRKNFGLGTAIVRSFTPYVKILLGK